MTKPEIDQLVEGIFAAVKSYVQDEFTVRFDGYARATDERLKSLVLSKGDAGRDGKDGRDGHSVGIEDVRTLIDGHVKTLPAAKDGRDGAKGIDGAPGRDGIDGKDGAPGERGEKGADGIDGKNGAEGVNGKDGTAGIDGKDGADGLNGKDGAAGVDGKDGAPGADGQKGADGINGRDGVDGIAGKDGAPGLRGEKGADGISGKDGAPGADGQRGADGLDGKDGTPGLEGQKGADGVNGRDGAPGPQGEKGMDGKSVTLDEIRPIFEGEVAKWALDFERRAGELMQKAIDRIPAPQNGKDGRDGADALGIEHLSAEKTGDRSVSFVFKNKDAERRFQFSFPVALDAGVFQTGKSYEAGDGVTYAGSWWLAQKDTSETPGKSADWRLAVKRGQNGKDGAA